MVNARNDWCRKDPALRSSAELFSTTTRCSSAVKHVALLGCTSPAKRRKARQKETDRNEPYTPSKYASPLDDCLLPVTRVSPLDDCLLPATRASPYGIAHEGFLASIHTEDDYIDFVNSALWVFTSRYIFSGQLFNSTIHYKVQNFALRIQGCRELHLQDTRKG